MALLFETNEFEFRTMQDCDEDEVAELTCRAFAEFNPLLKEVNLSYERMFCLLRPQMYTFSKKLSFVVREKATNLLCFSLLANDYEDYIVEEGRISLFFCWLSYLQSSSS